MTEHELPKAYDFQSTEQRLYQWWEQSGYFKPANDPNEPGFDPGRKPFVISIPPPNVTGELHLGHAMFVSMEDLMIRYHRMKGIPTLWVPGADHAGIATQLQVEKLLAQQGQHREQIGREEFLRRTWAWKEKYGGMITRQIRRLGASCDWSRERFTLDPGLSKAVREAFVRLYEKGLIYRGPRMINWSPGLKTAVSDLEVEYTQEPGFLYYFQYRLAPDGTNGDGEFIPVATTRPETILGDSAVAVHPEDPRYQKYVGRKVVVPILGRQIPVIADDYVDREFGTGALKITPAHDPNDYQIGQRHNLEMISMLDEQARVNQNGGPYAGMDRFEARKRLWADMTTQGLVIKAEPYTLNIPRSQRGGEIVEPMISTQWFVNIKPMAEPALEAVRDGCVRIVPERFTKVYYNWLENIQDWCISRQLWWGHRIPVWYCQDCGEMIVSREDPLNCPRCSGDRLEQDPDVLDTWFSSGLWPFSTLGWPEETLDYKYFYPTTLLETGYDILFFWVARMIMDGLEFTGQAPFRTVYLHGLIRDEHGHKMSKTKGNVIDPLVVMDELGTDALRFTLLVGSTPGNDMNLSTKKVEANRNFANKLWNAGRYVIGALPQAPSHAKDEPEWTLADRWIHTRLAQLLREVARLFDNFQYGEAGRQIYDFFWSEFADWYLEISKLQMAGGGDRAFYTAQTLLKTLDTCLRLLHPFTPFVTEEMWGHLKAAAQAAPEGFTPASGWEAALIVAHWPEIPAEQAGEAAIIADFNQVMEVVRSIRNVRMEQKIAPSRKIPATIIAGEKTRMLCEQADTLRVLAGLDEHNLLISETLPDKPQGQTGLVVAGIEIYLPLTGLVDVAAENARLNKELSDIQTQIHRLETLLTSNFAQRAPSPVVEKERQRLAAFKETAAKLREQLAALQ
ncbi:MAG: valine--tRNA ligase [Anaerolineaceae bacterium]|nr:valine--tRNA ligase [Anaerolineaceae bacterium]